MKNCDKFISRGIKSTDTSAIPEYESSSATDLVADWHVINNTWFLFSYVSQQNAQIKNKPKC